MRIVQLFLVDSGRKVYFYDNWGVTGVVDSRCINENLILAMQTAMIKNHPYTTVPSQMQNQFERNAFGKYANADEKWPKKH